MIILAILISLFSSIKCFAQIDKKMVRQGNRQYEEGEYENAELSYRRALSENDTYSDAYFNIGDALYRQMKYEDAAEQFIETADMSSDKIEQAEAFYNLGNSLLKAEQYDKSIEAFKNSLRANPENMEAKYNLAYAQDMLKQQQEQQQNQQEQQEQDNQDGQDGQDNQENQENQENQNNQEDGEDSSQEDNNNSDSGAEQQQQNNNRISQEDAERILNALAADEKEIQEKVNEQKAAAVAVPQSGKNW